MKETGTIKKINGKIVHVAIAMHDGCESCINNSCKNGRSDLQSYNAHGIDVTEGDLVEIEVPGAEQARGAFWVLGMPLVALFVERTKRSPELQRPWHRCDGRRPGGD